MVSAHTFKLSNTVQLLQNCSLRAKAGAESGNPLRYLIISKGNASISDQGVREMRVSINVFVVVLV